LESVERPNEGGGRRVRAPWSGLTFPYQTNLGYHYTSLIVPVFAWAAILYIQRVKDFGARRALAAMILLATVF